MKDSEFIELLNLYLDHEISAADAAKLEAEVQNNPARRRVYQQYCRIQKACKIVAADFQTEEETAVAHEKKVVAFDSAAVAAADQRRRSGRFYTIGTFAAVAACVAIIFVGRSRESAAAQAAPPIAKVAPAASSVDVAPNLIRASTSATPRGLVSVAQPTHAVLVTNPLLLTGNTRAEAVMAAAVQQANDQLAWLEAVQLAPLQQRVMTDNLRFDAHPASLRPEGRALGGSRNSADGASEMSALRFVK